MGADFAFVNACRAAVAVRPATSCAALWASPYFTALTDRGGEALQDFALVRGAAPGEIERQVAALREDFNRLHPGRLNPDGFTFPLWEDGRWTGRAEAFARDLGLALP